MGRLLFGRFVKAWHDRDWVVALLWLGLYLFVLLGGIIFVSLVTSSDLEQRVRLLLQVLLLYPWAGRIVVFFLVVVLLAYLHLFSRWIARDPARATRLASPALEPVFSRRTVRMARWCTRGKALAVGLLVAAPLVYAAGLVWFRLPRFQREPNVIHIYVARLWDQEEGVLGVSLNGERAQQAIKSAIEVRARLAPALRDRVRVRSLNCVISPEDLEVGAGRARRFAGAGKADVVAWGRVLHGQLDKPEKYDVIVTSAIDAGEMHAFFGPEPVLISEDPASPRLSHQPLALGCFVLGYASFTRRDFGSALTFFTTLADTKEWWADRPQRDKDRAALTFWIADCHLFRSVTCGGASAVDAKQAIRYYDAGLKVIPRNARARSNLGAARAQQGDWRGAAGEFAMAVRLGERDSKRDNKRNSDRHSNRGLALAMQGDFARAIDECQTAVRLNPRNADAYANLCGVLKAVGKYDKAIEECEKAIRINPSQAAAHANLGGALLVQRDYAGAERECREALRLYPRNPLAHFDLGCALALGKQRDFEGAEKEFRETLRLDPNHAYAHLNLARVLVKLSNPAEAAEHFQRFLELMPGAPEAPRHARTSRSTPNRAARRGGRAPALQIGGHSRGRLCHTSTGWKPVPLIVRVGAVPSAALRTSREPPVRESVAGVGTPALQRRGRNSRGHGPAMAAT